jgi:hypothetical protein
MSTITEIERANERLPASEVGALAAWLEEYRAGLDTSASIPAHAGQDKSFMKFAGSMEGLVDLSQRKAFSAK